MASFPLPPANAELVMPGRINDQSRRIDVATRPVLQKPRIYDTYVENGPVVAGTGMTQAGVTVYWEPGDMIGVMLSFSALSTNGASALQAYLGAPGTGFPYFPNAWQSIGGTGSLPASPATGMRLVYNTTHVPALVGASSAATAWSSGFVFSQPFFGAPTPDAGLRRIEFHVTRLSGTGSILVGSINMKVIVV